MAEPLGSAELILTVNDQALRAGLAEARKLIEGFKPVSLKLEVKGAAEVQKELRNISTEADRSTTRVRTLNQLLNDIPGGSYSKISAQIQRLSSQSRELTLQSEQYVKVLQRIRELEIIRSNRVGRSNVQADFQAQQTFLAGEKAANFVPPASLPNTTAADLQLISELTLRLKNVDRASGDYEVTLRQLEQAQRRVSDAVSGRSSTYRQLEAQEQAAIRRAEKLAGIQAYYSDMNPRAGGIRSESGAILARGANSVADERAYNAALRPAKELLDLDLKREQTLRRISQRILATAEASKGGFGDTASDPVAKSIRRNQEKRDRAEQRRLAQLDALEADLARVRESRLRAEREKLAADKAEAKATKDAAAKAKQLADTRSRRGRDAAGSAIIGGAFPLLFGQSIGASLGGAAGGAAGGALGGQFGFGLSLVGTALGAQFDLAIQKSGNLAKALSDPIGQFGALQQNALLSSKGLEKQIEALIAMGREAEAAALIQEDLAKTFGNLDGAKDYLAATDNLNRAWTEASVTLTNFVAGPLAAFLDSLTGDLRRGNIVNRSNRERQAFEANATPEQRRQLAAFINRRNREISRGGVSSAEDLQFYKDVLAEIERLRGKDSSALKAAAAAQRVLTVLTERRLQIAELIARAELGGNKSLSATLQFQAELIANGQKRLELEQALRAERIKKPEKIEKTRALYDDDNRIRQRLVDNSKESLDNSIRELQVTKQLSGLEGTRLEVAKRRVELSKLFGERAQRGQEFAAARNALDQNPNNLNLKALAQGAADALGTAGVNFEIALRNASDYLKKAAKDAATSLTQAKLTLGSLQASPGGLNAFLTPDEQFRQTREAIVRLGPDLEAGIAKATKLLNIPTGQANERFQGLRDIFANAQQGVFASQAGFDRLQGFLNDVRAREEATTGLSDAQKTLADVTSLNATVQKELQATLKTNNDLLTLLVGKDWAVNVAVNGAQSAAYGDVLNRAASLP